MQVGICKERSDFFEQEGADLWRYREKVNEREKWRRKRETGSKISEERERERELLIWREERENWE